MWKGILAAAAMACAMASQAMAGEWRHEARTDRWQYEARSDRVFYGSLPVAHWYGERPTMKPKPWIGPRERVARCPHHLCGYPLPIYKAYRPWPVPRARHVAARGHEEWCAARYRTYDARSDTYQPRHGARRYCRSPYR